MDFTDAEEAIRQMEQDIADNDQLSDPYKVHLTIAVGRVDTALMVFFTHVANTPHQRSNRIFSWKLKRI